MRWNRSNSSQDLPLWRYPFVCPQYSPTSFRRTQGLAVHNVLKKAMSDYRGGIFVSPLFDDRVSCDPRSSRSRGPWYRRHTVIQFPVEQRNERKIVRRIVFALPQYLWFMRERISDRPKASFEKLSDGVGRHSRWLSRSAAYWSICYGSRGLPIQTPTIITPESRSYCAYGWRIGFVDTPRQLQVRHSDAYFFRASGEGKSLTTSESADANAERCSREMPVIRLAYASAVTLRNV
jgi:hypothetical protein